MTPRPDPDPSRRPEPARDFGPPTVLKGVVVGLLGATAALTLELMVEDVEPRVWRSLGIGFGLMLGFIAYDFWINRRRRMIAEGRNPDDPRS